MNLVCLRVHYSSMFLSLLSQFHVVSSSSSLKYIFWKFRTHGDTGWWSASDKVCSERFCSTTLLQYNHAFKQSAMTVWLNMPMCHIETCDIHEAFDVDMGDRERQIRGRVTWASIVKSAQGGDDVFKKRLFSAVQKYVGGHKHLSRSEDAEGILTASLSGTVRKWIRASRATLHPMIGLEWQTFSSAPYQLRTEGQCRTQPAWLIGSGISQSDKANIEMEAGELLVT